MLCCGGEFVFVASKSAVVVVARIIGATVDILVVDGAFERSHQSRIVDLRFGEQFTIAVRLIAHRSKLVDRLASGVLDAFLQTLCVVVDDRRRDQRAKVDVVRYRIALQTRIGTQ